MQVMWLGSDQQLKHVNINIPVLSTAVPIVESKHDLGVLIDSQLTRLAHVKALCLAGYYQFQQLHLLNQ